MGETKIEWCATVWNSATGCTPISPGCANCYAARMAKRLAGRCGYPKKEPFKVTLHPERLTEPFSWRKPRRVFVSSMGDLFHKDVPMGHILDVLTCATACDQHTFIFLTKRPRRMKEAFEEYKSYLRVSIRALKNIWLGVSVENQKAADERIPVLLQTPTAVRFISCEPLLGPVDLSPYISKLDWIISGGESGPSARPMHPDWARSIRDQCLRTWTPFFFKQWGAWTPKLQAERIRYKGWGTLNIDGNWFPDTTPWNGKQDADSDGREYVMVQVGKKAAGRLLDGREWNEWPRQ